MQQTLKITLVSVIAAGFLVGTPLSAIADDQPQVVIVETTDIDEMDRELEILENEIAQLRRELRLRKMREVYKTKEWQEHYRETAKRLKAWRAFQQKYLTQ